MSLVNPVISELILATLEMERHAEVEQVRTRIHAQPAPRRHLTGMARRASVLGALKHSLGSRPLRQNVVTTSQSVLTSPGPSPDGRPC